MKFLKIFIAFVFAGGLVACAFLSMGPRCQAETETYGEGPFKTHVIRYAHGLALKKSLIIIPPTGVQILLITGTLSYFAEKITPW